MPEPTRRGRPGYDRDQIVSVAIEMFNRHGYDATSISALAARLGVSKAALYHHVDSKQELLRIALERALDALEQVLDVSVRPEASAIDRLREVIAGAVHVLVQDVGAVTLLLRVRGNSDVERSALTRRRGFDRTVTDLLTEAQREGSVRADVPAAVATRLMFGMVNSIVEWYRPAPTAAGPVDAGASQTGAGAPDLADTVLALALDGLRPR